jgi:RHS repeat-associated protein
MNPAPSPVLYEPPVAAKPQLREKPHHGLPSKNPAWNQGPNVCNFTVTLGLRATVVENGVGETYSARYYNPATGRFLSRDPLDGQFWNPKTLHKYLYASGDPVNGIDPTGRGDDGLDYVINTLVLNARLLYPIVKFGCLLSTIYNFLYTSVAFVVNGGHVGGFGDPRFPVLPKWVCAGITTAGALR